MVWNYLKYNVIEGEKVNFQQVDLLLFIKSTLQSKFAKAYKPSATKLNTKIIDKKKVLL